MRRWGFRRRGEERRGEERRGDFREEKEKIRLLTEVLPAGVLGEQLILREAEPLQSNVLLHITSYQHTYITTTIAKIHTSIRQGAHSKVILLVVEEITHSTSYTIQQEVYC